MVSRRAVVGAAASLGAAAATGQVAISPRKDIQEISDRLTRIGDYPLVNAIYGRRSRRFSRGATIPSGPLAFKSKKAPKPISDAEKLLLLTTMSGCTGWANLIPYNRFYSPKIPNYAATSAGRTFPSAAGFHTTEMFFTDDSGTYFFPTKNLVPPNEEEDLQAFVDRHQQAIVRLGKERLAIPTSPEHMEAHNDWCANVAGSSLFIPVADLALHQILNLFYLVQNGACIYDDVNKKAIPGIDKFADIVDVKQPYPLTYLDQMGLSEVTVEVSTSCYSGMLMQQALGLGGWMYAGINPLSVLGASGDSDVPGLGFSHTLDERWDFPNVTGLEGHFEGHCPPHYPDMASAVDAALALKFGEGGPFNQQTPGPYKDNTRVRGSGLQNQQKIRDCVVHIATYLYEEFGKFPATVPSIFTMMYLQAHELDLDFYNTHFAPGAYLASHKERSG